MKALTMQMSGILAPKNKKYTQDGRYHTRGTCARDQVGLLGGIDNKPIDEQRLKEARMRERVKRDNMDAQRIIQALFKKK